MHSGWRWCSRTRNSHCLVPPSAAGFRLVRVGVGLKSFTMNAYRRAAAGVSHGGEGKCQRNYSDRFIVAVFSWRKASALPAGYPLCRHVPGASNGGTTAHICGPYDIHSAARNTCLILPSREVRRVLSGFRSGRTATVRSILSSH